MASNIDLSPTKAVILITDWINIKHSQALAVMGTPEASQYLVDAKKLRYALEVINKLMVK